MHLLIMTGVKNLGWSKELHDRVLLCSRIRGLLSIPIALLLLDLSNISIADHDRQGKGEYKGHSISTRNKSFHEFLASRSVHIALLFCWSLSLDMVFL